jgi:two-component system, OmpR family, sensor histidine kinase KdpD
MTEAQTGAVNANRTRRGELRIYLGAAPGVGKTYAMLGEAHRRRERGTDVVVGYVETYGRDKTEQVLQGLEIVPRHSLTYRGTAFTEMDVAAVLARRPEVVLVDELAHTNVPGSRNEKRWQDIEELLDAGITVLSTVNVQHLEGLNDVVERITGITQHETVPDAVVRQADQIELVDITPEALRRRLAHGNVYPAQKIDAALGNYFRTGNLTALRELALLWVADQVDVALQRYRAEHDITETWETRERVVVAISGGPESETLIRRGRRIAVKAGGDLMVLHVLRGDGLAGVPAHATGRYRRLAEDLGASYHSVVGDDVPAALLDFARGVNATQLVVGTSRRSRLARLFEEGIGATTVQESGPIDVHMVTHDEAAGTRQTRWSRHLLAAPRSGWVLAIVLPVLVALVGVVLRAHLSQSAEAVAFVLTTVVVALAGGLVPALVAAGIAGVLLDFFFTQPYYNITIYELQSVIALVMMLIVAVLVSLVVDRASRRAQQAAQARTEAALLASYARTVLTNTDPLARLLEKVRENFALTSVALLEREQGEWRRAGCAGGPPCDEPDEADVDVPVTPDVHLALRGRTLPAADQRVLEAAAGQALLALRQQRMIAQTAQAQRRADATELRTALLSAVGHDLRTPLTSIKAAIGSLRDPELILCTEDTSELMATVEESADRLVGLVDNLLDSSRLATGAVQPQLKPVGYDEVAARALSGIDNHGAIAVDIDEHLPRVLADAGLLERVIANVADNALRYGNPGRRKGLPDGEPAIAVRASEYRGQIELRVVDHGPGLPKDAADTVFTPFQRLGDRDTTTGVGLGLSVAKGFVDAMGGTIRAEDTPGGGLTIVLSFPVAEDLPIAGHTEPAPAEERG